MNIPSNSTVGVSSIAASKRSFSSQAPPPPRGPRGGQHLDPGTASSDRLLHCTVILSALVNLLELALGPLERVLGLHALHSLGVHVHDDVLRVRLGGLRRGRPLIAEHLALPRGAAEDLKGLVDP